MSKKVNILNIFYLTKILPKEIKVLEFKKNEYISRTLNYKQFLQSFPKAWVKNGILLGGLNSTFNMFQYFCCDLG